jgi:tRNA-splicing ligase RtcB (3'-phosphate/5'-hydroxy nucleic acid ligase)
VAHNQAKVERPGDQALCVHRKGATRALGPSSEELPSRYCGVGQPVFLAGSMGTASYVLAGTDAAEEVAFASCCHGAGRSLTRTAVQRRITGIEVRRGLEAQGITVRCSSDAVLAEEAPLAYRDVDRVVDAVVHADIARKVARLRPVGVLKG